MHVVISPQVQDLSLVEPYKVPLCTTLQPVQTSLNGSTDLWCVRHSSQLHIISKVAEGAFYPFIQVIDEDGEQDQTQYQTQGNTTSYRHPTRLCSVMIKKMLFCIARFYKEKKYST